MSFAWRTLCFSKEDVVSFPKRKLRSLHRGHCVLFKEEGVSLPRRTMCCVQRGQFDATRTGTPKLVITPKPVCRNLHTEMSKCPQRNFTAKASKRPPRNNNDVEFFRKNKFRWPYFVRDYNSRKSITTSFWLLP